MPTVPSPCEFCCRLWEGRHVLGERPSKPLQSDHYGCECVHFSLALPRVVVDGKLQLCIRIPAAQSMHKEVLIQLRLSESLFLRTWRLALDHRLPRCPHQCSLGRWGHPSQCPFRGRSCAPPPMRKRRHPTLMAWVLELEWMMMMLYLSAAGWLPPSLHLWLFLPRHCHLRP